jgi:hypothetical protein
MGPVAPEGPVSPVGPIGPCEPAELHETAISVFEHFLTAKRSAPVFLFAHAAIAESLAFAGKPESTNTRRNNRTESTTFHARRIL